MQWSKSGLREVLSNRLSGNLAWMLASQFSNRLLRVFATIVVARMLGPEVYGLAALVLAINEMVHVLSHGGISGKLVQAASGEIDSLCATGYWMNWILCLSLTAIQILAAWPLSGFYDQSALFLPVVCLAFTYLFLPLGTIQAAMLIRENRLDVIARVEMIQSVVDTALTLIFALAGFELWALVLPKLLVAPLWVYLLRKHHSWRPQESATLTDWRKIFRFGKHLIWIDMLSALRNNIDYLIIGRVLGVEALGVYYFAFNAGLGLSQGLLRAASTALYPHLCELRNTPHAMFCRFIEGLRKACYACVPIIFLQALFAPVYLPLLFGKAWVDRGALPLLVILCLSALPRLLSDGCSQLLRAANLPHLDTMAQTTFTIIYGLAIAVSAPKGLIFVVSTVLVTQLLFAPIFFWWVKCEFKLGYNKFLAPQR